MPEEGKNTLSIYVVEREYENKEMNNKPTLASVHSKPLVS